MKFRTKAILASLTVVVGLVVWFLVLPAIRFSKIEEKYPMGMSFSNALAQTSQPYRVQTYRIPFPQGEPTEEQKRNYGLHDIVSPEQGIYLEFNYYDELITIIPIGSPIDLWRWSWKRRSGER